MNRRGQFSVIAALLVAVVLVATVVATYSSIRTSQIRERPPIQSAIDETNLAIKQILGFTVGYYGSILKTTGNSTYAKELSTDYLHSGLVHTANMHPSWGTSFEVTNSHLSAYWYSNMSYSGGDLSISYNLTGLGITGITYDTSCSLNLGVMPTISSQAHLMVTKDEGEPLVNLGKSNFKFYTYETTGSRWSLVDSPTEPLVYANGTYQIDIPSGVDVNSYLVEVEDQRGIIAIAASYSHYEISFSWETNVAFIQDYVDNCISDVDGSPDKGTHSNFTAMKYGPDSIIDTLTEKVSTAPMFERWISPITHNGNDWTNPENAYDNNTATRASISIPSKSWSSRLRLVTSAINCQKIRYYIGRSSSHVNRIQIHVYNGDWIEVYDGEGTWDTWTNVSFTEMSITQMRMRFYNNHGSADRQAYVYEAQFLESAEAQNCELDLEAQWTDVDYNNTNQWLCIFGGSMGSEDIRLEIRNDSTWKTLLTDLSSGWNNISVSQYISSSTLTVRFKGSTETLDPVQDSWQIDAMFLRSAGSGGTTMTSDTIVAELLQNGTLRWLGKNLQITTQAKPIPPIPVKALHVNQTILEAGPGSPSILDPDSAQMLKDITAESGADTSADDFEDISALMTDNNYSSAKEIYNYEVMYSDKDYAHCYRLNREASNYAKAELRVYMSTLEVTPYYWRVYIYQLDANNIETAHYIDGSSSSTGWTTIDVTPIIHQLDGAGFMKVRLISRIGGVDEGKKVYVSEVEWRLTTGSYTDQEMPFQIEDWASDYRIPLGLTNNASVFNGRTMLVFLVTPQTAKITVWWNGSDIEVQTPYAYENKYFLGDDVASGILTNGIIKLKIERVSEAAYGSTVFKVTSTQGNSTAVARFMRINSKNSTHGAQAAFAIHHGVIRDIVHIEPEWSGGAPNCPNVYAHIVLTLPANVSFYTYQLRLMFVDSQQIRTITDMSVLKLTVSTGQPQTENGTSASAPIISSQTGLFYNQSASAWAHHWSQFISGTKGAGIMFTDCANMQLYHFDTVAGNVTGAISVSNSTENTIEIRPVAMNSASFQNADDVTWHGAIATFDGTTPIYKEESGTATGLWMIVEYLPTVTVDTGN